MITKKMHLHWLALTGLALTLMLAIGACEKQTPAPDAAPANNQVANNDAATDEHSTPAEPAPDETPDETPEDPPAAQDQQPQAGMVPLVLELPAPMFVGTPRPTEIENLEPARTEPRPDLMVPEGTELLSLGQPVTSSDENPVIGWLDLVTDGDKEGMDGSWVELTFGVQWVQIDLGQPQKIYAIVVWHYHRQATVYKDVVVQVADDPDFITNVRTLFNNDMDNSAGLGTGKDMHYVETNEGKLIAVDGVTAQYVRLYSNGNTANDQNFYTEVEVYGMAVE